MLQKLPLGLQDFREIIQGDYKYIDKTKYIHSIASRGKFYFLSRPRRFGKSLTVSTLQELYNGSKTLFKGLWIEDKWDWNKKKPVVRLSLKDINFEQRGLEDSLSERIHEVGQNHSIELKAFYARDKFRELILSLSTKGKVVVLVDEYDAPIIEYLSKDIGKAYENRDLLKSFYSVLKDLDTSLELVFLTGVSKFSKIGIFSGLNNLVDLSMHPAYATMLGYTQEELEINFSEEIEVAKDVLKLSREDLLEKLRVWYNGYKFHHKAEKVYNPVSINNFFDRNEFYNFWFATGTPTFLFNILRKEGPSKINLTPFNQNGFGCLYLHRISLETVLFQTGFLTIGEKNEDDLVQLIFPNKEVKDTFQEMHIEILQPVDI
jgi:PAS domain-containing protein